MEPEPGVGLPGLAMQQRDVVWMQNAITNGGFIRRTTLHGITQLTGVAVPIVVAGDVIAILEFFGERPSTYKDSMIQFFRLLNIQLQQVIDRQLSAHREKAQLAASLTLQS